MLPTTYHFKTIAMHLCSRCNKTFPALFVQEGDGDETYEACPHCGNDMFLSEVEDYLSDMPAPPTARQLVIAEKKPFDVAAWQAERDRQEQADDDRIEEYQRIYAEQGKAAAEMFYMGRTQAGTMHPSQIKLNKIA